MFLKRYLLLSKFKRYLQVSFKPTTEQQNAIVSFETINITSMCLKKNKLPGIHDCELRLFTIILLYTLLALPCIFLIYHLDAVILVHLTTRKDGLWRE